MTALDESGQRISLPDYLKVKYEGFRQGRDYFESLEGHETEVYGKKLSLAPGYLDDTMTWGGSADLTYNDQTEQLTYGSKRARAIINVAWGVDKIHCGVTYALRLPDFPHPGGNQYGDYATVWFRVYEGPQGDEYLHRGRGSAGCITVTDNVWSDIYKYLINKRRGVHFVGTIARINCRGN